MKINYKDVVPWGRCFDEYINMFSLSPEDLDKKILDCGGGPSGFNADLAARGGRVISVDPIYDLSEALIRQRIEETRDEVLAQTRENTHRFIWRAIASVEDLGRVRMAAMTRFLEDYEQGKRQSRYVCGSLPSLPFDDKSFDLALSSHFLFLYSANLSFDFHTAAVHEMLRLAREVRVFPLVDLNAFPSPHVQPLIRALAALGHDARIEPVDYEFQKGGNRMLRILARKD